MTTVFTLVLPLGICGAKRHGGCAIGRIKRGIREIATAASKNSAGSVARAFSPAQPTRLQAQGLRAGTPVPHVGPASPPVSPRNPRDFRTRPTGGDARATRGTGVPACLPRATHAISGTRPTGGDARATRGTECPGYDGWKAEPCQALQTIPPGAGRQPRAVLKVEAEAVGIRVAHGVGHVGYTLRGSVE